MPDRVLVTGGAGFVGSHTVDRLLGRGFDVRVLDRLHPQVHADGTPPTYLAREAEFIHGDVRDLEAVRGAIQGVSEVVHLAAETSVGQSMYESDVHVDVNARGTATLFRAIREEGKDIRRVVISSSRAVYGEGLYLCDRCGRANAGGRRAREDLEAGVWTPRCPSCASNQHAAPTHEDVPPVYTSSYGMTKLFQEQIAEMEAAQLDISLVVLRYFNVYGPRQSPWNPYTGLITTLCLRLLGKKSLVLYEEGTPIRDFVHVDDVVWANVRAVSAELEGSHCVLNVGSGRALTLAQLARELMDTFGIEVPVKCSGRYRLGDVHAAIADIGRAANVLGYVPRVEVSNGLNGLIHELEPLVDEDRSEEVEMELREKGILRGT